MRLEFFIEPFSEGSPGRHVTRAIRAVEALGLNVDMGAFSSSVEADPATLGEAARIVLAEALAGGASRVSVQVTTDQAERAMWVGGLHDALERMIAQVEDELGGRLSELDREGKQAAVRILDERGALLLRRAIEDIADAMGVSRITIYNYLSAIRDE